MALLVSVSDVIESMGMSPELETEVEPAVTRAIKAAQARLETELDSALDRFLCKDTFHLDSDRFSGAIPGGLMTLRLRQAFVGTLIGVKYADSWNAEMADIPSTEYKLHAQGGLLYVDQAYDGKFVQVEYRAGFLTKNDATPQVKQAILYFVPTALKLAQPADPEQKKTANETGAVAQGVITALARPVGLQYRPMFYDQTASAT